jgi:hypothetical protein
MLKVIGQRSGGLIARARIVLQATSNDCLQIAIERWND